MEPMRDMLELASKNILDPCCGARMIYFDKNNPAVLYMDKRRCRLICCDGRKVHINPDKLGDFRHNFLPAEHFSLVIFDPPHLIHAGENSWLRQKYGALSPSTWQNDLRLGFSECFRVLKPTGTLIFKWNELQIKLSDVLPLALPYKPLLGHRKNKTFFLVFFKHASA